MGSSRRSGGLGLLVLVSCFRWTRCASSSSSVVAFKLFCTPRLAASSLLVQKRPSWLRPLPTSCPYPCKARNERDDLNATRRERASLQTNLSPGCERRKPDINLEIESSSDFRGRTKRSRWSTQNSHPPRRDLSLVPLGVDHFDRACDETRSAFAPRSTIKTTHHQRVHEWRHRARRGSADAS